MLISDLMTSTVESIRREATLEEAITELGRARVSALPVVDRDHRVVGIISEGDVLRQGLPADPRAHLRPVRPTWAVERAVHEVMTPNPQCATARQDSAEVALTLARRGWKSMPVIDEESRLLGMVSRSDFLRELSQPDAEVATAVHDAFVTAGHPEWHATVNHGHVVVDSSGDGLAVAAVATAATVPGIRSVELPSETERSGC
ncbi:MAG: CBS domain-containing protein [Knoellia sp.]